MTNGAPPVICVDHRRVNWSRGTGAASYAQVLRQSIPLAGFTAESLVDAPDGPFTPPGRAWRWTAAMAPWRVATSRPVDGARMAKDVFRRAQVHFDIYGRYLRLRGPVRPALMHWSYPLPLHFAGVPNLYSVLDLIPLLQPDLTPIDQARAGRMLGRLRQEAAHLVTISEASRREIIATLDWPADRVTNTYLAVDVPAFDPVRIEAVCAAAGVSPGDYVLHVGTIERRKNIGRLVEAYRASLSGRALVLAGPDGWGARDEMAAAEGLLVAPGPGAMAATGRPRVLRIDWMGRADLMGLMQGAAAVLAPALAEGFGLPVVEAMALGIPTLTSHDGAPREVAGGAAVLIDPLDVRAMAAGITALDRDAGLRASLSAAGRVRARAFTQAAYAVRLADLYTDVLERAA
jgi:glycosyltransferase involved in cell wall biosynthesis